MTIKRRVLLLGATGFIGTRLREAFDRGGFDVVCGVHRGTPANDCEMLEIDYMHDLRPSDWLPRLEGVDVVVNTVGILRETRAATFQAVHVDAPAALFSACAQAGVAKIVQVSALGADARAASRYHLSKKRADDILAASPVPWVIVQPSLVFGEGGASAALFARLALLPVVPLPGAGDQYVQPIHVDDLVEAIVRVTQVSTFDRQRIQAVGPRPVTLRAFLAGLRQSLARGRPRFVEVPMPLVRLAAALGERLPGALLDRESLGMLVRGNVGSPALISEVLGRPPRPAEAFVDRPRALATAARLAWLLPLVRWTIGIVWIATAIVSFGVYSTQESYAMLARVGLTGALATAALYGAAALDLAFGVGVFVLRDRRWLWRAQMMLIVGYSIIIAIFLPEYWLHPFGPVLKNLPMLAAILMLHELEK